MVALRTWQQNYFIDFRRLKKSLRKDRTELADFRAILAKECGKVLTGMRDQAADIGSQLGDVEIRKTEAVDPMYMARQEAQWFLLMQSIETFRLCAGLSLLAVSKIIERANKRYGADVAILTVDHELTETWVSGSDIQQWLLEPAATCYAAVSGHKSFVGGRRLAFYLEFWLTELEAGLARVDTRLRGEPAPHMTTFRLQRCGEFGLGVRNTFITLAGDERHERPRSSSLPAEALRCRSSSEETLVLRGAPFAWMEEPEVMELPSPVMGNTSATRRRRKRRGRKTSAQTPGTTPLIIREC